MLEIFAELSLYERILAVEGLSVRPRSFSLTRTAKFRKPPPPAS